MSQEIAWLIEQSFDGRAHWWYGSDFTSDAAQAVRFCRRQDAGTVIMERGLQGAVATEHMFISEQSTPEAPKPIASVCEHGVRWPHECDACFEKHTPPAHVIEAEATKPSTADLIAYWLSPHAMMRLPNGDEVAATIAAMERLQQYEIAYEKQPPLPKVDGYDRRTEGHYSAESMQQFGALCAINERRRWLQKEAQLCGDVRCGNCYP